MQTQVQTTTIINLSSNTVQDIQQNTFEHKITTVLNTSSIEIMIT